MNDKSTPAPEARKRRLWPLTLTVFSLILVVSLQIWQQKELEAKLNSLSNTVSQQTSVIQRALGKVIPIELHEALISSLSDIEARVADQKSWPQNPTEAEAMVSKLREIVRQIPTWAEEDLLPRLNAVRWGTSALLLSAKASSIPDEELSAILDSVETAIEAKPEGAPQSVLTHLTELQSGLQTKLQAFRRDTTIAEAERSLKGDASSAELSAISERLSEWADIPDYKEQIQKFQGAIQTHVLTAEINKFVAAANVDIARATKEPSSIGHQIMFAKLVDDVASQRQALLTFTASDQSLANSLTELAARIDKAMETEAKAQVAEQDKKLRDYQGWALAQIKKFKDDMDEAEKAKKGMIWNSADYERIKDDMVNFLVPISAGMLDSAVAHLYNEAFERGWKQLENKKELQTDVAKQEVVIQKRKL